MGQLVVAIVTSGEPVTVGGARTLVVETVTGRVVGDLQQEFGNQFYDARLGEDLLTLSVDDFRDKWLSDS